MDYKTDHTTKKKKRKKKKKAKSYKINSTVSGGLLQRAMRAIIKTKNKKY